MVWWKNGLYFSCLGCGRCCRGEPGAIYFIDDEEIALAGFLSFSLEEFRRRYVTLCWTAPSLKEKPNGECIFHDSVTNLCSVYPVRPSQCVLFPFWPALLFSREEWDAAAIECPGMNSGEYHSAKKIAEQLAQCPFPELL